MSPAIQILCISFALLFVACDRNTPEADSQSSSEQSPVSDPPVDDPFQQAEIGNNDNEIKPKDWWIFPVGTIDPFCQDWYSGYLIAAKESKVYPDLDNVHYRFTWLRTFHHPFIFHISESKGDGYTLTVTKLSGKGGYEPGEVSSKTTTDLSAAKMLELRNLLKKIDFWGLPSEAPDMGLDGAQWILESVDDKRYHVVDRWSAGVLEEVGRWFMKTGKIDVPDEDIY